jgi:FkbM family methyltransferase
MPSLPQLLQAEPRELPKLPVSPVVIYGVGQCGRNIAHILQKAGRTVTAFLDRRASTLGRVNNLPCFAPDSAEARAYLQYPVILGVYNCTADVGEIEHQLRELGFAQIISYYEFFEIFPQEVNSKYWLAPRSFYQNKQAELSATLALLNDEKSRAIFLEIISLRTTFDLQWLRQPDRLRQYAPLDLPTPQQPMRLIDGGSYTGDTLANLLDWKMPLEAVACFEPEPANYRQICQWATDHLKGVRETLLLPCGLGASTHWARFSSGAEAASTFDPQGNNLVQVVALDNILPEFAPTFLKLDIEGSEKEALQGASQLIRRFRPTLAICIYHKPEDLWEIPLWLHNLVPDYDFSIRYHGFNGFDIVLYAHPR